MISFLSCVGDWQWRQQCSQRQHILSLLFKLPFLFIYLFIFTWKDWEMGGGKNNVYNIATAQSILLTSTCFLQHHIFLSTSETTAFLFYNSTLQREMLWGPFFFFFFLLKIHINSRVMFSKYTPITLLITRAGSFEWKKGVYGSHFQRQLLKVLFKKLFDLESFQMKFIYTYLYI